MWLVPELDFHRSDSTLFERVIGTRAIEREKGWEREEIGDRFFPRMKEKK